MPQKHPSAHSFYRSDMHHLGEVASTANMHRSTSIAFRRFLCSTHMESESHIQPCHRGTFSTGSFPNACDTVRSLGHRYMIAARHILGRTPGFADFRAGPFSRADLQVWGSCLAIHLQNYMSIIVIMSSCDRATQRRARGGDPVSQVRKAHMQT